MHQAGAACQEEGSLWKDCDSDSRKWQVSGFSGQKTKRLCVPPPEASGFTSPSLIRLHPLLNHLTVPGAAPHQGVS